MVDENSEEIFSNLTEGDLVLIPHYMSGDEVPGRMVLAKFYKKHIQRSFYSKRLVVLHQQGLDIVPRVTLDYNGSQYIFEKTMFDHPAKNGFLVNAITAPHTGNGEVYIGLDEILETLEKTRGYEAHAASLAKTRNIMEPTQ